MLFVRRGEIGVEEQKEYEKKDVRIRFYIVQTTHSSAAAAAVVVVYEQVVEKFYYFIPTTR